MKTVNHILKSHYSNRPDDVAIYFQQSGHKDKAITYRTLLTKAVAIQRLLINHQINPGDVVILILKHSEPLIFAYFGCILHGAIPSIMPYLTEKLQAERYREELKMLISVTKPSAIITYAEFKTEVITALSENGSNCALILVEDVGQGGDPCFELENRKSEDILLLQHSSGTTGLQKGIALSHISILNQITAYAKALHLSQKDIVVSWLPLYHDMGLIAGFLLPILYGLPLVLMSPFDWVRAPYRLMKAISEYLGTLVWLPNFAYNFCAQKIRSRHLEGVDLRSLRAVINCSEPMRYDSHQLFLNKFQPYGFRQSALATSYAMAENTFAVTQGGIDEPVRIDKIDRDLLYLNNVAMPADDSSICIDMVSAGKAIPHTEIKIVGQEGGLLPDRNVGEIALKSNCMLSEYYNRTDITEKSFVDGWFLTGDYGYLVNGQLFITGRKKDLIIVGGKNIFPQDLEEQALKVQGVYPGRVVAFGIFSERIGTEQVIMVAETETCDEKRRMQIADDIRKAVTQTTSIVLRYVHVVDKGWIIKTSSGKKARSSNRDKFIEETRFVLE